MHTKSVPLGDKEQPGDLPITNYFTVVPEPGGGAGGLLPPPPIFCTSVNPILTGKGRLFPPITTGTPNVFHPASLSLIPKTK